MTLWLALAICGLLLGLAAGVVVMRSNFAAACAFIAYGLLLTMAWLQLRGVDVALTEAAIGGGLTGALLIGAVVRMRGVPEPPRARPGTVLLAALAGLGVAGGLAAAVVVLRSSFAAVCGFIA
jgi:uncharacterized MnhB-related membrane protein